jgi:hypothetical protein
MNRLPALRGGLSNTLRSLTSVSCDWVGRSPSVLSVIDLSPAASGQRPALRISLLGSSCQCALPAQDAGAPSDRVSAGTVPALLEHRNALNRVAARIGSPLPSPVIGMGLCDAPFRSGLVTSSLAALDAISLVEACRDAAGCGPRRRVGQRTASQRYRELIRAIAYRVYRHYCRRRNGRRRRDRGVQHRRSQ